MRRNRLSALGIAVALCAMQVQADEPAADVPQSLRDLAARLELQKKIADARRSLLESDIGSGATLPSGAISIEEKPVVPSIARFVAYDALRRIADAICEELRGETLIATSVNLRDLRDQEAAVTEQLKYLAARAALTVRTLDGTAGFEGLGVTGAGAALLALDSVGAIGKAIAGLAGFFKTERKIATVENVIDDATLLTALRACRSGPVLVDPVAVPTEPSVPDVGALRRSAELLHAAVQREQAKLDGLKAELADIKGRIEAAKDDEKKKLQDEQARKSVQSAVLESRLKSAGTVVTVIDGALDKLYAVDEKSGISPVIALARMAAARKELQRLAGGDRGAPPVLTAKVQHASGYTQISRTWWRSDKLDFAGGIAVTYQIATVDGAVRRANAFYLQTPWMRLQEGTAAAHTDLQRWR